jgi:hypothetical protein
MRLPLSPRSLFTAAIAVLCIHQACAQTITVPRYEEENKPAEVPVPLPAFPKKENLLRFPTDGNKNEVYIDTASFVIGDGDTLNYTLLIKGSGGADNLTFESIRCATGERRILAYGKNDGTWSPARNQNWQKIQDRGINRYYYELYRDAFCDGQVLEYRKPMLNNIRLGGRPRPDSFGDGD